MKKGFLGVIFSIALGGCSSETVFRSDVPATLAAAKKVLSLPLPASAHNIHYLFHAGGLQDLELYLRFDVPKEDVESTVNALIAANHKTTGGTLPYPIQPVAAQQLGVPRPEFLPMTWWEPHKVINGYFRGEPQSYALQILVDTDHSRIYLYQND